MKSIASKLVKIMSECDYVQKGGVNKFHNYKYASAADVLEKVNTACVKHNVASIPMFKMIETKNHTTAKGGNEYLVTVGCSLLIVDGDSGEMANAESLGTGQDVGDKAVAKAQTMALKYAWMTMLNISTGDDPEADESVDQRNTAEPKNHSSVKTTITTVNPTPSSETVLKVSNVSFTQQGNLIKQEPKPATEAQRRRLFALQKKAGMEQSDLKLLVEQLTGKTSTADLTADDVQKCFADLEVIIKAKENKEGADA